MPHRKRSTLLIAVALSLSLTAGARADIPECGGRVIDVAAREIRAEEAVPPDVYIAVRELLEIRAGSTFKVYRPDHVGGDSADKHPLTIYVGRLQIIDLQGDVVIGRMIEFAPRRDHPRVRYETVMVGDCLELEPPVEHAKTEPEAPAPETVDVTSIAPAERRVIPSKVLFKFDSARIEDQWSDELDGLAGFIAEEKPARVVVEGHADWTGPEAYNVKLSRRRAQAVIDYLTSRHGLDKNLFEIQAHGESRPEVSNATKEGRRRNRRAATIVLYRAIPTVEASVAAASEWPLIVEPVTLIPDTTEIPHIPAEPPAAALPANEHP